MISRDNRYSTRPLSEGLNTLPVGIPVSVNGEETGEVMRNITFRKLSHNDLKLIWDRNFTKAHPMKWVGRVLSLVVDNIDGEPVYSRFKANNFKPSKIPEIILELSNSDANYVMYGGHVFNFGTDLKDVRCKCDSCGKDNVLDVDMGDLKVEYDMDPSGLHINHTKFDIKLSDGFKFTNDEKTEDTLYKHIAMRCPTLGDAVRNEQYFQLNDQGSFSERMYQASMLKVWADDGTEFDEVRLRNIGPQIFGFMTALDSSKIETAISAVPSLIIAIDELCKYCSGDLQVFVQSNFLYPRRS